MSYVVFVSRVPLERDNSEEFLKREARASQLAEEIEASATYKARVALENDDRSEEEKYTAVVRGERELHSLNRWRRFNCGFKMLLKCEFGKQFMSCLYFPMQLQVHFNKLECRGKVHWFQ